MIMKINSISHGINHIGNSGAHAKQNDEADRTAAVQEDKVRLGVGTKVDLSEISVDFSRAAEKMNEAPEERTKKIEELKMKIENDEYHIDSKKIAEKIIAEELSNIIGY